MGVSEFWFSILRCLRDHSSTLSPNPGQPGGPEIDFSHFPPSFAPQDSEARPSPPFHRLRGGPASKPELARRRETGGQLGTKNQELRTHSLPSSSRKISSIGLLRSSFGTAPYSPEIRSVPIGESAAHRSPSVIEYRNTDWLRLRRNCTDPVKTGAPMTHDRSNNAEGRAFGRFPSRHERSELDSPTPKSKSNCAKTFENRSTHRGSKTMGSQG
jgi:hypothetical protein